MKKNNVCCMLCGNNVSFTGKKPRDKESADIVICEVCGHIQMYPLLSPEETQDEYDNDTANRFGKVKISEGSDFETMRLKFSEWSKEHADIYFETLQGYRNVLDLGAGYGFFMEEINKRPGRNFNIEGIEIGKFRLDNFVGGIVYNLNVLTDKFPDNLHKRYDCIISIHLLEHIGNPILFLEKIKPLLKEDGHVIFEVPNINCYLGEISPVYKDFMYFYEHCSYFSAESLRFLFEKSGYSVKSIQTYEIYSIENHCRWVRDGVPSIKLHQMYMPDARLEWINRIYKDEVGKQGKGYSLTITATPKKQ